MLSKNKLVSIVIITRNRAEILKDCLTCVFVQDYSLFEVIVVDSSNEENKKIILEFPKIKYIYFANGANKMPISRNIGIKNAKGQIIAFLDDDAMCQQGWLREIVFAFENDHRIGGVGEKVINKGISMGKNPAVGKIFNDGSITLNFEYDVGKLIEVDWIAGCNMAFSKEVFKKIGGFDREFKGNNSCEDNDFCARAKKAGFILVYNSKAVVDHLVFKRDAIKRPGYFDKQARYYGCRNLSYFYIKNFGLKIAFIKARFLDFRASIIIFLRSPSINSFNCLLFAIFGYLVGITKGIPTMFKTLYIKI